MILTKIMTERFLIDFWGMKWRNKEKSSPLFVDKIFSKDFSNRTHLGATLARARRDFNHGLCGFARIIWLTCKFLCLTFFSRKDTKNNSLREHRSVASYIRPESKLSANVKPTSLLFAPVILSYAKGKGAVCDCSRQALRDTQIMFVSSNLISPLLGELEGVFA